MAINEGLLDRISAEYPEEVGKMTEYEDLKPPISKEHLLALCEGDSELIQNYEEMIEYFYRYTRDVCVMESLKQEKDGIQENLEEIRAMEAPRSALHNAMIDSVKIFARNLEAKGKDVSWFAKIDKGGRIGYANLALLITFVDILNHNQAQ